MPLLSSFASSRETGTPLAPGPFAILAHAGHAVTAFSLRSDRELAESEEIESSNMPRALRLTLLAPDIVEVILSARQSQEVTLARALRPFPMGWAGQRSQLSARSTSKAQVKSRQLRYRSN
jgi:hypothetical protein